MSIHPRFTFQTNKNSNRKSTASDKLRLKHLCLYAALILSLFGGVSFVIIKSGAQELKATTEKSKPKKYTNLDVRVNNRGGLDKVLERSLTAAKSSIADINDQSRQQASAIKAELADLKKNNPTVEATISPLTGAVEVLRSSTSLTKARRGVSGNEIVREFIQRNKKLYGLTDEDIAGLNFVGESVSEVSGMRMVIVEQMINGHLVFQSDTKFILDRDGRLIQSVGTFFPNAVARAAALDNLISPQQALRATMETVGVTLDAERISLLDAETDDSKKVIKVDSAHITDKVTSRLVYFQAAPGVLIPAWSQVIFGTDADWYALADAADGTLLWRKNIRAEQSTQQARFRVYVQADGVTPADNPAPLSPSTATVGSGLQGTAIAPTIVDMLTVQNSTASPNGWINDCPGGVCTATETRTEGNNTITCLDRVGGAGAGGANQCDTAASSVIDGNGMPTGNPDAATRNRDFLGTTPRDFQTNFLPPPQGGNPEAGQTPTGNGNNGTLAVDQFRRGVITQLFYTTNYYHDRLYALGFTPAARNFQNNNFGGGGLGNDRVLGDAQDSSSTDNANFATPPDGQSGRMQMFRFIGPTVDRDASLDAEIVIHELTHGTSNRLIGNGAGLVWDPGVGLGEGWSDFYALALLNNTNADTPTANYASGSYSLYKAFGVTTFTDNYVYGIRRFPYSTVNTVNPLTWADIDQTTNNLSGGIAPDPLGFNLGGALEVHNSGELWTNTLWEVRSRIIADPAGANGSVPTGNNTILAIVTDAMKLTPSNPSFIQARNALIDADCASNACANESSIWAGFADRGLGYYATVPNTHGFAPVATHLGVKESFDTPKLDINTITVNDSIGGNNSGFVDPGETVRLTVNLTNPLRRAGSNAASTTATLTSSTPGVVFIDSNSSYATIAPQGNANGDTFTFRVAGAGSTCGTSLNFTLNITSSLGTISRDFVIRLGQPSGTAAPVTYTTTNGVTAIQDNRPNGVIVPLTVTDDFEIADLNVRVNSISHTFPGDVTVGIKSPGGYGTDVITFIGGAVAGGGDGDNITNMVLDQQATGDILLATNAQAPYTGSWLPIASSPSWPVLGFGPQDAVELNRLNGTSTQGTWNFVVSDQAAVDAGTVNANGLSIIVTPRAFVCALAPTAANASVSGRVFDADGRAVSRAIVKLSNLDGETRTVITNAFGYYRFEEVAVGQTYSFSISGKKLTFPTRIINVNEDIEDLNFTADR